MRNVSFLHEMNSYPVVDLSLIQTPFTDNNILEIQDKFLTNGLHYIKASNVQDGRTLIFTFLNSLSFVLHAAACITTNTMVLPNTVIDLHKQLNNQYLETPGADYMHMFFFEQFYFDFIWVEATPSLLDSQWYIDFEKNYFDFNIDKNIPMIVITYHHYEDDIKNLI